MTLVKIFVKQRSDSEHVRELIPLVYERDKVIELSKERRGRLFTQVKPCRR